MKYLPFILFFICLTTSCSRQVADILDADLSMFVQVNGTAPYTYEDGVLVGTSVSGSPNSFLALKKRYRNFTLDFDVWVDGGLNSGVQIRSNTSTSYREGRVHGYQVEIDTSPRRWSGGIYDESRRGWLYPVSLNPAAYPAFKNGKWNHYRIEAIGPHIKTWINDVPVAHLVDDMTAEGMIAFQVHSIYDQKDEGKKIRWKNIKIVDLDDGYLKSPDSSAPEESYLEGSLSKMEAIQGWQLSDDIQLEFPTTSGLEIKVDFQLSDDSRGFIKYADDLHYHIQEAASEDKRVGSLDVLHISKNLSEENNPSLRYKGNGNWNRAHIILKEGVIEHWLNGIKVLDHERAGAKSSGISLVEEEGSIKFKNLKWRAL